MRGQQRRIVVPPVLAPLLALTYRIFCTRGGVFCHRPVIDKDTTKGGATPPLGTTDPCPSSLAHASARWGRSPLSRLICVTACLPARFTLREGVMTCR